MNKLNGVFSVIKPTGITSAQVCKRIKNVLNETYAKLIDMDFLDPKVGHGGTLDYQASGVLAVGVGDGCKQLSALLHGTKIYKCTIEFGVETDTLHADGRVVRVLNNKNVNKEELKLSIENKLGYTEQIPPLYSAIKFKGKRLSDLVMEGQPLPVIKPRKVLLKSAECLEFKPPLVTLILECGGGFYVRSLARDLANDLNTCGHVKTLERIMHGPFTVGESLQESEWTFENIQRAIS
ncbi:DgyrCDS11511 [Dimorphilus gyrociliatus]|uniref:tRNA pseudouridine(55) synthase n=1 Tax=Dimorphilus gyrociliatus TaxID=2664684 RepID=A0A7I8W3J9_9ANNE|nr:DgyrCDS11511 [Dimorphilus gyrociliatus]